jgi:hypothetical protein
MRRLSQFLKNVIIFIIETLSFDPARSFQISCLSRPFPILRVHLSSSWNSCSQAGELIRADPGAAASIFPRSYQQAVNGTLKSGWGATLACNFGRNNSPPLVGVILLLPIRWFLSSRLRIVGLSPIWAPFRSMAYPSSGTYSRRH